MGKNDVTNKYSSLNYRAAREHDKEAWRGHILDVAGRLLTQEGAAALTMRRLAQDVGCSTTVLYTMFVNKEGVISGLYEEGFSRLCTAFEAVPPHDHPLDHLEALGWAYRANALANPTYYGVMFERVVPGFTPPDASVQRSYCAFTILREGVQACVDAGLTMMGSVEQVANVLWTSVHGQVSLELAGYFPDPGEAHHCFALLLQAVGVGLIPSIPPPSRQKIAHLLSAVDGEEKARTDT